MKDKPLPCPFCGEKPDKKDKEMKHICRIQMPIKAWNRLIEEMTKEDDGLLPGW